MPLRPPTVLVTASALALALLLAACGASQGEIRRAREARYQGAPAELFEAIRNAVATRHPIEQEDRTLRLISTARRWYQEDGTPDDRLPDTVGKHRPFVELSYVVTLSVSEPYHVEVRPLVHQRILWQERPTLGLAERPLPGWVEERADALRVAIHARLRAFEIATR